MTATTAQAVAATQTATTQDTAAYNVAWTQRRNAAVRLFGWYSELTTCEKAVQIASQTTTLQEAITAAQADPHANEDAFTGKCQ